MSALDAEIDFWWCLGLAPRCTPAEAIGLWSTILFYTTMFVVTVIHSIIQSESGTNEQARRHTTNDVGDDLVMLCWFMAYFFSFAAGCLLWAFLGTWAVHPIACWQVQLAGSALLCVCVGLFVASHVDLGENWSPEPERKARHKLVTHGIYRWARHPMYAIFLWASIGTLLATLNWLIAWCVFGTVIMTLRRIETEERILVELFGGQYLEYRRRVSALGPPWQCLGFDRDKEPGEGTILMQ